MLGNSQIELKILIFVADRRVVASAADCLLSQLLARRPYSSTLDQQLSLSKRLLERSCPWTQNLRKSKSKGGFLIILAYTILRKTLASIFGYPRILGRTKERPYLISGNPSDKSSAVPCCLLLMQDRTRLEAPRDATIYNNCRPGCYGWPRYEPCVSRTM